MCVSCNANFIMVAACGGIAHILCEYWTSDCRPQVQNVNSDAQAAGLFPAALALGSPVRQNLPKLIRMIRFRAGAPAVACSEVFWVSIGRRRGGAVHVRSRAEVPVRKGPMINGHESWCRETGRSGFLELESRTTFINYDSSTPFNQVKIHDKTNTNVFNAAALRAPRQLILYFQHCAKFTVLQD